jgi:hypothetical protein
MQKSLWTAGVPLFTLALLSTQMPAPVRDHTAQSADGHVMELTLRERWTHGSQQPSFTPFDENTAWIHFDSVRSETTVPSANRGIHATLRNAPLNIEIDGGGRIVRYEYQAPPPRTRRISITPESDRLPVRDFWVRGGFAGTPDLPQAHGWDAIPTFHPESLIAGATWVDTLEWSAERTGAIQRVRKVRWSLLRRDSIVDGHLLWVVHDSSEINYQEQWPRLDWSFIAEVEFERDTRGVRTGTHLYDPVLRMFVARWDTTNLTGTALKRLPDGRQFATPAAYESTREWKLYTPSQYGVREQELKLQRRREWTGPAGGGLGPRFDSAAWDSLVTVLAEVELPAQRAEAYRSLRALRPAGRSRSLQLRRIALELGDTAVALERVAYDRLDADGLRLLLPFLDDPGRMLALRVDPHRLYSNVMEGIAENPPVLRPDTSEWGCTPEACRLLASQVDTATEPRLLDLALLAAMVQQPRAWYERVVERAEQGSIFAQQARALADGAATWYNRTEPAPGPDADWRRWRAWMGRRIEFLWPSRLALRFYEARTGVSLVDAFQRTLRASPSDSARLVFGTMLLWLDESGPAVDDITANLDAESEELLRLGRMQIAFLIRRHGRPAETQVATQLVDVLLTQIILGGPGWPGAPERRMDPGREERHVVEGDTRQPGGRYLLVDSLPSDLINRWRDEIELITWEAWNARSDLLPGELIIVNSVRQAGPFVEVGVHFSGFLDRTDVGTPWPYHATETIRLRRTDSGWVYVSGGRSIT